MMKQESYTCSTCSATYSDANQFVEHVTNGHKDQEPDHLLQCPQCPLSFDRTQDLKEHMQTIHQTVPSFSIQATPILSNDHQGLTCPQCKNPFANKYSLMKHLRSTKCKLADEASINRVINEQLTCTKCKHQFGSLQALNKHLEAKKCNLDPKVPPNKGGLVFDESIQLTANATVSVFKCPDPMCSKPCVTLRAYRMHAKCVHKGSDSEPLLEVVKANYICKVRGCGKLFVEEQQLDVHFKHHENYTPRAGKHKCHLCSEAFYQKDMLKRHVLSFHEEVSNFKSRKRKKDSNEKSGKYGYKRAMTEPNIVKYDPNLCLAPGTLMTVYSCGTCKKACTDIKSFKLHCLHVHQDKNLVPEVVEMEAKFICQVENCGKLYMEKKQFEIHQRHHKTYVPSTGRYFKCAQCDSKFNSQANLDVHAIQVHMNSDESQHKNDLIFDDSIILEPGTMINIYNCPVPTCDKKNYLDAKSVKTHCRRVHHMNDYQPVFEATEAQFICQVRGCRKLFVEAVQIEAHLKHHRNYIPTNGIFECKCCTESFTRKEQLDAHTLNTHTYDGILKSQESHQSNPVRHTVHGSHLELKSSKPVKSSPSDHIVIGYQCSICLRKFLHLGTHSNHVTNTHQMPGLQPVEVEMRPRYTCKHPQCGKPFMTKNMYKAHVDRHKSTNQPIKKSMKCLKCPRLFSQFKSLHQHLIQTHADVSAQELAELEAAHAKCPICSKVFRNQEVLKTHMKKHNDRITIDTKTLIELPVYSEPPAGK